ncbi:MAG TPA: hypothetical protein VFM05_05085, partial [Candidatus Saccharimonadales bacterium]|nr:hypothetical protein [Candidatus Saccharimonadales bacterium]
LSHRDISFPQSGHIVVLGDMLYSLRCDVFYFVTELYYNSSGLTASVSRLGWEGGVAAETEKPQAEKRLKNAARTPSRLHALLGAFLWELTIIQE